MTHGKIKHEDITSINVSTTGNTVVVKAIKSGCSLYEKTYLAGEDFTVSEGKLTIRRKLDLLTRGSDDPLLGPTYEEVTLGIDQDKQGKSKNAGYAAGLVFMLIPVAVSETTEIVYKRLDTKPGNYHPCIAH